MPTYTFETTNADEAKKREANVAHLFESGIVTRKENTTGEISYTLNTYPLALHLADKQYIKAIDGVVFYYYDGCVYREVQAEKITQIAYQELIDGKYRSLFKPVKQKELLKFIGMESFCDSEILEKNRHYIALENKVLNLNTMQTEDFSPEKFVTNPLPFSYDPSADCPMFKSFAQSTFWQDNQEDTDSMLKFVQEIFGYTFYRDMPIKSMFFLLGPKNSGRSSFLQIIDGMLGDENTCTVELQRFEDQYYVAQLLGSLANIVYETPDFKRKELESSTLKAVTSGKDKVNARHPYGRPFRFTATTKHFYAMNEFPRFEDMSGAVFKRIYAIQFKNQFEGKKDIKDYSLKILEAEKPGIFNWALEGLERLNDNNWIFSTPRMIVEVTEHYKKQANHLYSFLIDCVVETENEEDILDLRDIRRNEYKEYLESHFDGAKPETVVNFVEGIKALGYRITKTDNMPKMIGYKIDSSRIQRDIFSVIEQPKSITSGKARKEPRKWFVSNSVINDW